MAVKIVEDYNDVFSAYDPARNTTRNIMTKYEKTAVLALRIEQLARGAAPCVPTDGLASVRDIALAELKQRTLPFVVVRTLPSDVKEYWRLKDLIELAE
jgi:DNA-directed RNA polymerase subunit K/omega